RRARKRRTRSRFLLALRLLACFELLGHDVVAQRDTLVADVHAGTRDELSDIVLMFVAEGASERTRGMCREGPPTLAQRSGISLGAVRVPAPGCACSAAADPFSTHGSVRASVRMPI